MLQKITDVMTRQKWLAYSILGALALVFAAWGAYGIVDVSFGGTSSAAKVNGVAIPLQRVQQAWQAQQAQLLRSLNGGQIPDAQKKRLQNALLESFIRQALMTQRTHDLGYRADQAQVTAAIRAEPAFQVDGQYNAQEAKLRLAQAGISIDAYAADLRQSLQRQQVEEGIEISDFVTPHELARLHALESEERQVRYVTLPAQKFAPAKGDIPDKAVKAYYEQHKNTDFMTRESAKVKYAGVQLDKLAAKQHVTEAQLHDYYNKHKDHYVVPERRRAQHILIATGNGVSAAQALQKAKMVLAKVRAGGDFAKLAKQYSDDPGSAAKGGNLGWSVRDDFVKPFADALFSMKVGEVRGPVKSQYGYHIIKLDGIQPGHAQTFEQARADIESQVRQNLATDRLGDIEDKVQQMMEQNPDVSIDVLAKSLGMHSGVVDDFVRGAGGGDLGNSQQLEDAVFSDQALNAHQVAGPVILDNNRLVVVQVVQHRLPAPKPLSQVRDSIIATLRKQRGTEAALKAARAAVAQLKSGAAFDKVAHGLGVKSEPARFVGRNDPSVPQQLRAAVFAAPKPGKQPVWRVIALHQGGAALFEVSAVKVPTTIDAQLQATRERQFTRAQSAMAFEAYVDQLRRTAKVQKNPQTFD